MLTGSDFFTSDLPHHGHSRTSPMSWRDHPHHGLKLPDFVQVTENAVIDECIAGLFGTSDFCRTAALGFSIAEESGLGKATDGALLHTL